VVSERSLLMSGKYAPEMGVFVFLLGSMKLLADRTFYIAPKSSGNSGLDILKIDVVAFCHIAYINLSNYHINGWPGEWGPYIHILQEITMRVTGLKPFFGAEAMEIMPYNMVSLIKGKMLKH